MCIRDSLLPNVDPPKGPALKHIDIDRLAAVEESERNRLNARPIEVRLVDFLRDLGPVMDDQWEEYTADHGRNAIGSEAPECWVPPQLRHCLKRVYGDL
eukprot:9469867-Pyramimonas_sp.AAC.1